MYKKRILLDTCGLLWLAAGERTLSSDAKDAIATASIAYVSAISAWEVFLKVSHGQIVLRQQPEEWFQSAVEQHGLTIAPVDIGIMAASTRLPWHHRDPADRFIIATALREKATVVTADRRFSEYGVDTII